MDFDKLGGVLLSTILLLQLWDLVMYRGYMPFHMTENWKTVRENYRWKSEFQLIIHAVNTTAGKAVWVFVSGGL